MRVNGIKKQFWLSKHDNEILKEKAEKTCLTEVGLIRFLLRGYEPKEKPDAEFYKKMNEISKMTDAINEVAALLRCKDAKAAEVLLAEVKRWHEFQSEIEKTYLRPERSKICL